MASTSITVESALGKLAIGETIEQIHEAHPRITKKDILTALAFDSALHIMLE